MFRGQPSTVTVITTYPGAAYLPPGTGYPVQDPAHAEPPPPYPGQPVHPTYPPQNHAQLPQGHQQANFVNGQSTHVTCPQQFYEEPKVVYDPGNVQKPIVTQPYSGQQPIQNQQRRGGGDCCGRGDCNCGECNCCCCCGCKGCCGCCCCKDCDCD